MLHDIQHIYLIGLGAMGCLYASRLYAYDPECIRIILDEKRKQRYEKEGVYVNGKAFPFTYVTPGMAANLPKADLIIIGVKLNQLGSAIEEIRPFIQANTRIISLLNGISSEDIIGKELGMAHMLYAYGVGMDAFRDGTHVRYTQFGKIVFGEKDNRHPSQDVRLIQALFSKAHITFETPADMIRALWNKYMLNVAANQVTAVLKMNYGNVKVNTPARNLMYAAAKEVLQLSQAIGTGLTEKDWSVVLDSMDNLADGNYTSMCQDVLAGRKTEVAMFGETVMALGEQYGVPTPTNRVLVELIHAIEEAYH